MNLFSSFFRRSEKHRAYTNLLELDDRLLRDIGLSRADVHDLMNATRTAHSRTPRNNA